MYDDRFFLANPVDSTYPANSCNTESGMSKFACTESTSSSSSSKSISAKTCLADDESCKGRFAWAEMSSLLIEMALQMHQGRLLDY